MLKRCVCVCVGLQDSDDEDIEGDIDQQIESILAPKRIVKEIKASSVEQALQGLATAPAARKYRSFVSPSHVRM